MPSIAPVLLLFLALSPLSAAAGAELSPGPEARVETVVDGDTVVLDDGAQVRLVGIQAPKLPLGRTGFRAWPLAEEAKDALESLVLGRRVRLMFGGARRDRHGRWLAHLYRAGDGLWVQGAMLERGWARVYGFADNRAMIGAMLERERTARAAGAGIWALDNYRPIGPGEAARRIGRFELVEGRVRAAATVGGRTYLNYGDDWREDFTVVIGREARQLFDEAGLEPESLAGRRIRVRGWLRSYNGPMIEATHPEQIEVLE